jgi:hypothetical protein
MAKLSFVDFSGVLLGEALSGLAKFSARLLGARLVPETVFLNL